MKTTFPKLAKRTGLSATYRSIASALARGRTVAVISLHQDVSIESLRAAGAIRAALTYLRAELRARIERDTAALARLGG